MRTTAKLLLFVFLLAVPQNFLAKPDPGARPPEPNIDIKGSYSANKVQKGRTVRATILMDIPGGYHVNANKPLGKYAIPTTIKIEAPGGVVVGPIAYPRALV